MHFHNILYLQHGTVRAVINNYEPIWSKYGAVTEEKKCMFLQNWNPPPKNKIFNFERRCYGLS